MENGIPGVLEFLGRTGEGEAFRGHGDELVGGDSAGLQFIALFQQVPQAEVGGASFWWNKRSQSPDKINLLKLLGAEVTIVDTDGLGGSAVLTDCVPSKTLIATAEVMTEVAEAGEGAAPRSSPELLRAAVVDEGVLDDLADYNAMEGYDL